MAAYLGLEPLFVCTLALLVSPLVTSQLVTSVGSLHTNGSTSATCYGIVIAPKLVVTAASCLYDHSTRTPRQKIQFSLNNKIITSYDMLLSPEWLRTGRPQEDWGVLILPQAVTYKRAAITWSPHTIEDIEGVRMATPLGDYSCTSAQGNDQFLTMKRVKTDFIAITCTGISNPKPGGAVYIRHGDDVSLFGIYSQQCMSGWGPRSRKPAHCAVRIGESAFRRMCEEALQLKHSMPECTDAVLEAASGLTTLDTPESYAALSNIPKSLGMVLLYCQERVCSGSSCQACGLCADKYIDNFATLSQLKTFHRRYVVRTVLLGDALRVSDVTHVPTVLVRQPGEDHFRQYNGYVRHLVKELGMENTRKKREADDESLSGTHESRRTKRMTKGSNENWSNKSEPLPSHTSEDTVQWCSIAKKLRRNIWKNDCTQEASTIFVTPTRKLHWLGQGSYRQTTLLKTVIRCEGADRLKVMCRDGNRKAETNLLNYLRIWTVGEIEFGSCELWITMSSLPSGGNEDVVLQLLKLVHAKWNVTVTRVAFGNMSPGLRFDDDCLPMNDANASISALRKMADVGIQLDQCMFTVDWWTQFVIFAGPRHLDVKSDRDKQARCERALIEAEALPVGEKTDCLYPNTDEGDATDFIGIAWTDN